MFRPSPNPAATQDSPRYARMIFAYRYGSLAIAAIGLAWTITFVAIGWWGVATIPLTASITGLLIYLLIRQGHFTISLLAGQTVLIGVVITATMMLDIPTAETPRVTHNYLLPIAVLGYLNYQRQNSWAQLALTSLCLIAFVVLTTTSITLPYTLVVPEMVRTIGAWINATLSSLFLAACIYIMQAEFDHKDQLNRDLMTALWHEEFDLAYQPQVDTRHQLIGAEALLRWTSPKHGPIPPTEFIPIMEASGLMIGVGNWVLEKGCQTLAKWSQHPEFQHLTLSVNISAQQLLHEDFEIFVYDTLITTGANPQLLVLELTESVLMSDMDLAATKLKALRNMGITISLDDFGTGYSSLSYLRRLPIQQIKVDKSFVHDAINSTYGAILATNIVRIGHDLGQTVLAEGVETIAQHTFMARVGCVQFQGYLYGRPMTLASFERQVENEARNMDVALTG